jgi:hypothetical protein
LGPQEKEEKKKDKNKEEIGLIESIRFEMVL